MPQLKKQTLVSGYLQVEFEVKVFEPGEPVPSYLRDSPLRLSDEEPPELSKPGERQFVTGILSVSYNKNTGDGEPDWVDLAQTVDLPVVVPNEIALKRETRQQKNEIRALRGTVTRLKKEIAGE